MALPSGTHLGSYEIVAPLGAGGMGEVYRARDAKLGRDVAIKVLPEDFASDSERVARFQREAQVLASLNHSNIGAIYDLQQSANAQLLILELVEGETLAQRIARGPIPADEAVDIAKQIAEALESAHEKGIIHRDLKPANIKITPEGKVKVLDFGLAKIYEGTPSDASLSHSPTLMSARTSGGVILGTVSYMSPEQARGRVVTKQTDIWAFGCVLFEMLTGRMAFSGDTVSDTIAKILKDEPDWTALNAATPPALRRLIQRLLHKDVRKRYHDVGDVRFELDEVLTSVVAAPVVEKSASRKGVVLAAVAILISILIGLAAGMRLRTENPVVSWTGTLLGGPAIALGPRASPDGKMLAFQALVDGNTQAAVMNPKSGNWTLLTHDKNAGVLFNLGWSSDGTKIYFDRQDALPRGVFSIPALGGEPRLLIEDAGFHDALPDGSLIICRVNSDRLLQLYRFKPDTGEPHALNAILIAGDVISRSFPDGKAIVFFGKPADAASSVNSVARLYILDLNSNTSKPIGPELNPSSYLFGLAVNPLDNSVLVEVKNGDLHQILAIPSDGRNTGRVLLTLTSQTFYLDMSTDGSLYVDQVQRPQEAVRFGESTEIPEAAAVVPESGVALLELPDGRVLMTTLFDGRSRLLAAKPNGELVPFVDTEEETSGPVTFAGAGQVAFMLGKPPQQSIAVVSIKDGRVLKRLRIASTGRIFSLSASSDGHTIFYSDGGSIWSIPAADGEAHKLGPGDAVAFDSRHQDLVVQLNEKDAIRLARLPVAGGTLRPIPINSELRIANILGPNAVRADGQIVVQTAFKDSWFWGAAVLNPESGMLRRIPLRYDADLNYPSWNHKNQIISGAALMRASIWRFRPQVTR